MASSSDRPVTPGEIESVRFEIGQPGDYRVDDVDPFVGELLADVRAGRPIEQRLAGARFRMATKRDHAYSANQVDAFVAELRGRPVSAHDDRALDPSQTHTPAPRGLWSRIIAH